jgi:hypothetical protein
MGSCQPALPARSAAHGRRGVIITCGGPFDAATGHYLDNTIAWAMPA